MITNLQAKWRKFSKCHTLMFLASLDGHAMISNKSKETYFWSDRKELTVRLVKRAQFGAAQAHYYRISIDLCRRMVLTLI